MINPDYRFQQIDVHYPPEGSTDDWVTRIILDMEQRRCVTAVMDEWEGAYKMKLFLARYIDGLDPSICTVHFSTAGELLSCSSAPACSDHDHVFPVHYPSLQDIKAPQDMRTIVRTELEDLDSLAPNVDLVQYKSVNGTSSQKAVFKYCFFDPDFGKLWRDITIWSNLPSHPNILPVDRLVLDEFDGNVVGLTTAFVPGGTLHENPARKFRLSWLEQLLRTADDLNFEFGVMHQDIAPRNLLVDPVTDDLLLFDFNNAVTIGPDGYDGDEDDIQGVVSTVYRMVTLDNNALNVQHYERFLSDMEWQVPWRKHPDVELDHDVRQFQLRLEEWVANRRFFTPNGRYPQPTRPIEVPTLRDYQERYAVAGTSEETRADVVVGKAQPRTLDWQRPPRKVPADGSRSEAAAPSELSIDQHIAADSEGDADDDTETRQPTVEQDLGARSCRTPERVL